MTQTSTPPTNDFDPIITLRTSTVVSIAFPGHLPHLWTVEELRCAIRAARGATWRAQPGESIGKHACERTRRRWRCWCRRRGNRDASDVRQPV